jgi:hypothetical protein
MKLPLIFCLLTIGFVETALAVWTQKANIGAVGRDGAVGFSIGNKGYIGTGSNGTTYLNDFWEYDPETNVWIQKASVGFTA